MHQFQLQEEVDDNETGDSSETEQYFDYCESDEDEDSSDASESARPIIPTRRDLDI